jgi:hypothetical protein
MAVLTLTAISVAVPAHLPLVKLPSHLSISTHIWISSYGRWWMIVRSHLLWIRVRVITSTPVPLVMSSSSPIVIIEPTLLWVVEWRRKVSSHWWLSIWSKSWLRRHAETLWRHLLRGNKRLLVRLVERWLELWIERCSGWSSLESRGKSGGSKGWSLWNSKSRLSNGGRDGIASDDRARSSLFLLLLATAATLLLLLLLLLWLRRAALLFAL